MTKRKSFWLKFLIIVVSLVVADAGIGKLLSHFYFRIPYGEQGRLNHVVQVATDPILVLGSSRAAHHYIPSIISADAHLACYNAGKDKQSPFYYLAILKIVFQRYHPRMVIVDLPPVAFAPGESGMDELGVLLPYCRSNPVIRPILDKRSTWEWLKIQSSLYCYNSLPLQIVFNNLSSQRGDTTDGYIPLYDTLNHPPEAPFSFQQINAKPDTAIVGAFEEIIRLTQQNGCRLAIIVSPVYFPLPSSTSTIRLAKKLCSQWEVPFLDYTQSASFCTHLPLFNDESHMNNAGAEIFTQTLYNDLAAKGFWEPPK